MLTTVPSITAALLLGLMATLAVRVMSLQMSALGAVPRPEASVLPMLLTLFSELSAPMVTVPNRFRISAAPTITCAVESTFTSISILAVEITPSESIFALVVMMSPRPASARMSSLPKLALITVPSRMVMVALRVSVFLALILFVA